ncbi:thrombospondin type 3 repeat-containing protein [Thermodesulfobacteriota bacterium]
MFRRNNKLISGFLFMMIMFIPGQILAEEFQGNYELSPFVGYYYFDNDTTFDDDLVLGVRFGHWYNETVAAEIALAALTTEWGNSGNDADFLQLQVDGLYHFSAWNKIIPYLAAGIGAGNYNPSAVESDTKFLINYGGGLKLKLDDSWAARLDIRQPILFDDTDVNLMITLGLSYFFGSTSQPEPTDSDHDGIPDASDLCPKTPMNASVDSSGCPLDTDGDGIADFQDNCPDTSRGTSVDDQGCPVEHDTDGDGVNDSRDNCPDTPKSATVDSYGCPLDQDKDGVYDYQDNCPDTARGTSVDDHGCPQVRDADSDGDGISDANDKCPDTPRQMDVDSKGCPPDQDHDGIFDYQDDCPQTPLGAAVNENGCLKDTDKDGLTDWDEKNSHGTNPYNSDSDGDALSDGREVNQSGTDPLKSDSDKDGLSDGAEVDRIGTNPLLADTDGGGVSDGLEVNVARTNPLDAGDDVKEVKTVAVEIYFDSGSDVVKSDYYGEIEKVAEFLNEYPDVVGTIEGHTDSRGADAFNQALSQKRAASVVRLLEERYSIDSSRLTAKGYGGSQPVADNDTAEGRAKNRRINAVFTSR